MSFSGCHIVPNGKPRLYISESLASLKTSQAQCQSASNWEWVSPWLSSKTVSFERRWEKWLKGSGDVGGTKAGKPTCIGLPIAVVRSSSGLLKYMYKRQTQLASNLSNGNSCGLEQGGLVNGGTSAIK